MTLFRPPFTRQEYDEMQAKLVGAYDELERAALAAFETTRPLMEEMAQRCLAALPTVSPQERRSLMQAIEWSESYGFHATQYDLKRVAEALSSMRSRVATQLGVLEDLGLVAGQAPKLRPAQPPRRHAEELPRRLFDFTRVLDRLMDRGSGPFRKEADHD
jgi:hypothetical protein